MSTFQDLPNELVSRICHFVRAPDLLAFALGNKVIHTLAQDALKRHRELSKRYSLLEIGRLECPETTNAADADDTHEALKLLGTILHDPCVAYHPKSMRVGYCGHEESDPLSDLEPEDDDFGPRRSVLASHAAQLKQMVDECPFVVPNLKGKLKELLLQPENEHGAVSLLLTLLPNLKHVFLEDWSHCADTLRHVVGQIADANRDPSSPDHGKALTRLVECSMNHGDTEMGEWIDGFGVFAMLPSIRTLRGTQICGENADWPTGLRPRSSTVTEINFTISAIDAKSFRGLLEGICGLKKFTYSHGGALVGNAVYTPVAIIDLLRKHASQSLDLLDIDTDSPEEGEDREDRSIGSLHMFTVLKKIRLEENLFQLPEEPADFDKESPKALPGGEIHEEESVPSSTHETQIERLVDILPPSVIWFALVQLEDKEETRKRLEGLAEPKAEQLPKLKRLTFEYPDPTRRGYKKNWDRFVDLEEAVVT